MVLGEIMKNANKMNLIILIIGILFLANIAVADTGDFYVDDGVNPLVETDALSNCGSINGSSMLKVIPYYVGVDEFGKLRVSVVDLNGTYLNTSVGQVQVTLNESTWYNMSYNTTDKEWYSWLTSDVEEDVNFTVKFTSDIYNCLNESYEIKFRVPFYLDVKLFETTNNDSSREPQAYTNDFHYVYLELVNVTTGASVPSDNDVNRFFRSIYSWMPGIDFLYPPDEFDYDIVFWGQYTDGTSRIKVYEEGVYDVNLLTFKIDTGYLWPYEFVKPQFTEIKLDSKVARYNMTTEDSHTIKILVDEWEFNKVDLIINIVKTIVTVLIVLIGLGLLTFLPGGAKLIGAIVPALLLIIAKYMGWL